MGCAGSTYAISAPKGNAAAMTDSCRIIWGSDGPTREARSDAVDGWGTVKAKCSGSGLRF
jgi:hypothetical protein